MVQGSSSPAKQVLATATPTANTLTDLYTVPTGGAALSLLTVTNPNPVPVNLSLACAPGGAADTQSQYLLNGIQIPPLANSVPIPVDVAGAATDKLRVLVDESNVAIQLHR